MARRTLRLDLALALAISILLAHASQEAAAQDKQPDSDSEEAVYDLGPGIAPPRVIKQVNPQYSTKHGVRVVGSVLIGLIVSSRGIPRDLHILRGLDTDIDQSALDAVQQWRFTPAQKDGKAVAVRISLENRLQLDVTSGSHAVTPRTLLVLPKAFKPDTISPFRSWRRQLQVV